MVATCEIDAHEHWQVAAASRCAARKGGQLKPFLRSLRWRSLHRCTIVCRFLTFRELSAATACSQQLLWSFAASSGACALPLRLAANLMFQLHHGSVQRLCCKLSLLASDARFCCAGLIAELSSPACRRIGRGCGAQGAEQLLPRREPCSAAVEPPSATVPPPPRRRQCALPPRPRRRALAAAQSRSRRCLCAAAGEPPCATPPSPPRALDRPHHCTFVSPPASFRSAAALSPPSPHHRRPSPPRLGCRTPSPTRPSPPRRRRLQPTAARRRHRAEREPESRVAPRCTWLLQSCRSRAAAHISGSEQCVATWLRRTAPRSLIRVRPTCFSIQAVAGRDRGACACVVYTNNVATCGDDFENASETA